MNAYAKGRKILLGLKNENDRSPAFRIFDTICYIILAILLITIIAPFSLFPREEHHVIAFFFVLGALFLGIAVEGMQDRVKRKVIIFGTLTILGWGLSLLFGLVI